MNEQDDVDTTSGVRFMADPGMDFAIRCVLTGVPYSMAEPGEILHTASRIHDGEPDSWRSEWLGLADRLEGVAAEAAAHGHRFSAWGAYLRASNYAFAGNWYAPATTTPQAALEGWQLHRRLWDAAVANWPTPARTVEIPHRGRSLPGYWFEGPSAGHAEPLVIIVNGIETPMSDATMTGLADGVARGYKVLCFDGPGQGAALYERGQALTADWRGVLDSVLTWALGQPDVASDSVCVQGINHGGLFALLGVAGDERPRALALDPGVTGLLDDTLGALPSELADLYAVDREEFDSAVIGSAEPDVRFWRAKTLDPFPGLSPSGALEVLESLTFKVDHAGQIRCPVLIAEAESAQSFPGQSRELAEVLRAVGVAVTLEQFTVAEGAALDCEILAPQVRNQRFYDWIDSTLP